MRGFEYGVWKPLKDHPDYEYMCIDPLKYKEGFLDYIRYTKTGETRMVKGAHSEGVIWDTYMNLVKYGIVKAFKEENEHIEQNSGSI